jgi:hypothetical protein
MRARHHTGRGKAAKGHHEAHRAAGGPVPNVLKEVKAKSTGVIDGEKSKPRADRKRGGRCRAEGGRTGADKSPYSSAREGHAGAIPEAYHDDHEGSRHGLKGGGEAHKEHKHGSHGHLHGHTVGHGEHKEHKKLEHHGGRHHGHHG